MRKLITQELLNWLDTSATPWKPKENAPKEIKEELNKWLTELEEAKRRTRQGKQEDNRLTEHTLDTFLPIKKICVTPIGMAQIF